MNNNKILMTDEYRIFDKLAGAKSKLTGPLGWVRIYLQDKLVEDRPNLVVAHGREFVAQKLFNLIDYDTGQRTDWTNHKVSHFAIGSGGSVVNGEDVTLLGPNPCDSHLYKTISLGNVNYLPEPYVYDLDVGEDPLDIYKNTYAVKPITEDNGSIFLESSLYDEGACEYYTKVRCTCIIPSGEPQNLSPGESVQISEASLYFINGNDAQIFSHVCFPPKYKAKEDTITILWYILC